MKRFRNTMMHKDGADPAIILQGRVFNVNIANWTVDCVSKFDRKKYADIQVGSPYLHYSNGEGLSVMPEVGAQCMICIPGDSAPPFVLCFLMPHELTQGAADTALLGTRSHGTPANNATDASFAGGRPRSKPGDIVLRGRDGQFVILHRGGVLSIGASELAQRIYIPLSNLVTDVSGAYEHFNTGGAITWGIQEGASQKTLPAQHLQTFRVFADDKYSDIKIAHGRVFNPMPEPDGGSAQAAAGVGQGSDNPIIFELAVAPKGFITETGDIASSGTPKTSVLRFVFDRTGNTLLRCEGTLTLQVKKAVKVDLSDTFSLSGKSGLIVMKDGLEIDGGEYAHLKGKTVLLGPGKQPVARQGDLTSSTIMNMPCVFVPASGGPMIPGTPVPGVFTIGIPGAPLPIGGYVATGEYTVKA